MNINIYISFYVYIYIHIHITYHLSTVYRDIIYNTYAYIPSLHTIYIHCRVDTAHMASTLAPTERPVRSVGALRLLFPELDTSRRWDAALIGISARTVSSD